MCVCGWVGWSGVGGRGLARGQACNGLGKAAGGRDGYAAHSCHPQLAPSALRSPGLSGWHGGIASTVLRCITAAVPGPAMFALAWRQQGRAREPPPGSVRSNSAQARPITQGACTAGLAAVPASWRPKRMPPQQAAAPERLCRARSRPRIVHDLELLEYALHLGARQARKEQTHGTTDALRQLSKPRFVLGGGIVPQRHAQHLVGAHDKPARHGGGAWQAAASASGSGGGRRQGKGRVRTHACRGCCLAVRQLQRPNGCRLSSVDCQTAIADEWAAEEWAAWE